jgi:hypothetical protein
MLHLIRKELQGISTPSKRLKRYRAAQPSNIYVGAAAAAADVTLTT